MSEQTRLIQIDINDPDFQSIKDTITTYNFIGEKLSQMVESRFNLLLWIISIILSGLIGTFIQQRNYLLSLVFGTILVSFVIYFVVNKNEEISQLWKEYMIQKQTVINRGIPLPEKPPKESFFKKLFNQLKESFSRSPELNNEEEN